MIKSLLYTAFLTAILASVALGQIQQQDVITSVLPHSSFDFGWGGARAQGMGNAYLGLSDDINAGTWNPAGLVKFEGPMLGVSWGASVPVGHTDYTIQSNMWRTQHSGSLSNISGLNFIGPFRVKGHAFVGSVNYTQNFQDMMDFGYNFQFDQTLYVPRILIYELDTFTVDAGVRQTFEGGLNSVAFSVGTRIYNNSSIGLGVNIYTGKSIFESASKQIIHNLPIDPGSQEVEWAISSLVIDTVKFSGVNFTLAYKKTGERFNVGVVLRSPFDLNLDNNRSIYNLATINSMPTEEGTDTIFFDNQLTKYTMPLALSAGVAYNVNDKSVITMDAEYHNYSSLEYKRRDSLFIDPAGNNEEFFTDFDPEWSNTFAVRFGGEYRKESSIGMLPLRAGFGLTQIPWSNVDGTPVRYSLSAGTGIHWSQIMLDWAYTYSTVNRNWGEEFIDNQMKDHHFSFTFTGVF